MIDPFQLNGGNLSYIGDSYYELMIRLYLVNKGITSQNKLHTTAIKYVSAFAHTKIIQKLKTELTEVELEVFKRGRNQKNQSRRKNLDISEHNDSSGFEAILGYLYLQKDEKRLEYIMKRAIEIIEE